MKKNELIHYFSGIIFLGFALLLLALLLSNSIDYYIAPPMRFIVIIGLISFLVLGVSQLWREPQPQHCSCHEEESEKKSSSILSLSLLLMILLIGFMMPDYALSTKMAELRGISYHFPTSNESIERNYEFFKSHYEIIEELVVEEETIMLKDDLFLEGLGLLHFDLQAYKEKRVEITGFVYHDEDLEENEIAVGRFAFACCVADAIGYGIVVHLADEIDEHTLSGWVQVEGVVDEVEQNENTIPYVRADSLSIINEPSSTYVYPTVLSE